MRFEKGWIKSTRSARFRFSARAAGAILDGVDLVKFSPEVFDQGPTSSCVGHATSGAISTSFKAAGTPLVDAKGIEWVPSQAGIYVMANAVTRAMQGLDPETNPLQDEGSMPNDAMFGISQWGIKPMGPLSPDGRFSDATAETVVAEIDGDSLIADAHYEVVEHAVVSPDEVAIANSQGLSVAFGIFVDTAFENWNPTNGFIGAPRNPNDPQGGGHYVSAMGYTRAGILAQNVLTALPLRLTANVNAAIIRAIGQNASALPSAARIWFLRNSWGKTNWGLNGHGLFTDALLADIQTSDLNAMVASYKEEAV